MKKTYQIDLHPGKIHGDRPETALAACRNFLRECLCQQAFEARIITGLGLHGDGTPRLRTRVEAEVLPGFKHAIEATALEQGGAVIHVWFKPQEAKLSHSQLAKAQKERDNKQRLVREERLMVATSRYKQAQEAYLEDDLRKAKLKVNQFLREFHPEEPPCQEDNESIRASLDRLRQSLKAMEEG